MKRRDFFIRWGLLAAFLAAATALAPAERASAQEDAKPEMAADAPEGMDAEMEKAPASADGTTSCEQQLCLCDNLAARCFAQQIFPKRNPSCNAG